MGLEVVTTIRTLGKDTINMIYNIYILNEDYAFKISKINGLRDHKSKDNVFSIKCTNEGPLISS